MDDFQQIIESGECSVGRIAEKYSRAILEMVTIYSRTTILGHLAIAMRSAAERSEGFTSRTGIREGVRANECMMLSNDLAILLAQVNAMSPDVEAIAEETVECDPIEDSPGRFRDLPVDEGG